MTGVDLCRPFIEFAKSHRVSKEAYLIGDMEDLHEVPGDEFDVAVSYIALVDVPDMRSAVGEAFRVLRRGGRFVVCNLHPMTSASSGWINQGSRKLHYPVDRYSDEGERDISRWEGRPMTNFHRTLSTYFRTFLGTGFTVEDVREPTPTEEQAERYPVVSNNLRVPDFIIYILRKPCQAKPDACKSLGAELQCSSRTLIEVTTLGYAGFGWTGENRASSESSMGNGFTVPPLVPR